MEQIKVGLINVHKRMPTRKYIFDGTEDITDYAALCGKIEQYLCDYIWVQQTFGTGINQIDETYVMTYTGYRELLVYVYEADMMLIAALCATCAKNGVQLIISRHNHDTKEWVEQKIM